MVSYLLHQNGTSIFDPAVGPGTFFRAAKHVAEELGRNVELLGYEIDPTIFQEGTKLGLTEADFQQVKVSDFLLNPPEELFPAIIANPPYIRHHRLSAEQKTYLKSLSKKILGWAIDGRAGIHVYFFIQSLILLQPDGRLAFIMPADTCEGIFAARLWLWILTHYRLDAVISFAPGASPFPKVDTNPLIFLIKNAPPSDTFFWVLCNTEGTDTLKEWIRGEFQGPSNEDLTIYPRFVAEALETGLSRKPSLATKSKYTLKDFAKVVRGIATGANDFFFLTRQDAKNLNIPGEFLHSAVGRTRDVKEQIITSNLMDALDEQGRPTLLVSFDGRPVSSFPEPVQKYIQHGVELGLPAKALISTRNPWYKMETRLPPSILFAYLGRRNCRFILNQAGVLPLTSFLAIYPLQDSRDSLEKLWHLLNDPAVIANLSLVGKSYGDGALKVEPRALERLPIPDNLISDIGLHRIKKSRNATLF